MPKLIRGDRLAPSAQRAALRHFNGRYTGEHTPLWVRALCDWYKLHPQPAYKTDKQWLRNNYFWCTDARRPLTNVTFTLTKQKGENYEKVHHSKTQGNVKANTRQGQARSKNGAYVAR